MIERFRKKLAGYKTIHIVQGIKAEFMTLICKKVKTRNSAASTYHFDTEEQLV